MIINSFFYAEEMTKEFISAQSLLDDSYRLADQILDSGYRPELFGSFMAGRDSGGGGGTRISAMLRRWK